jgi:hypothetical protein
MYNLYKIVKFFIFGIEIIKDTALFFRLESTPLLNKQLEHASSALSRFTFCKKKKEVLKIGSILTRKWIGNGLTDRKE